MCLRACVLCLVCVCVCVLSMRVCVCLVCVCCVQLGLAARTLCVFGCWAASSFALKNEAFTRIFREVSGRFLEGRGLFLGEVVFSSYICEF